MSGIPTDKEVANVRLTGLVPGLDYEKYVKIISKCYDEYRENNSFDLSISEMLEALHEVTGTLDSFYNTRFLLATVIKLRPCKDEVDTYCNSVKRLLTENRNLNSTIANNKSLQSDEIKRLQKETECLQHTIDSSRCLLQGLINARVEQTDEIKQLQEKVKHSESIMATYNKNYLQCAKVKVGEKIARKDNVTVGQIKELQNQGLNINQIADKLNISRSTVWRRLKNSK